MKKSYTEYVSPLRKEAKRYGTTSLRLVDYLVKLAASRPDDADLKQGVSQMRILFGYESGHCTHLFLPGDGFAGWLADCAKTLPPETVDVICKAFSTLVCVHFPTTEHRASFVFIGCSIAKKPGFYVIPSVGGSSVGSFTVTFDGGDADTWEAPSCSYEPDRAYIVEHQKLIAGLALYMAAFPEQVNDGLPADLNNANHFKTFKAKSFGVSDKVRATGGGEHHGGPRPHYRSGHFCVLTAERYTVKRGQVIFRHGCFVAGVSKTVEGI